MAETLFFQKDPTIQWDKVRCPICNEPTGPKSKCYTFNNKVPAYKKQALTNFGRLPILSENCFYRQDNVWEASVNYPVSDSLIARLATQPGVERIGPVKTYTFRIVVARTFDEKEVKRNVNLGYRSFIKELQATEIARTAVTKEVIWPEVIGIEFPNGHKHFVDMKDVQTAHHQSNVLVGMLAKMPNAKPIFFDKSLEKTENQ